MCTVACVASPIVSFVRDDFDKSEILSIFDYSGEEKEYYEEIYNNTILKCEIQNANLILKSNIIKELKADNDSLDVNIITENKSDEKFISMVEVVPQYA